jgi:hypothetical protein
MSIIPTLPSDHGWAAAHSTGSYMSRRSWASKEPNVPPEPLVPRTLAMTWTCPHGTQKSLAPASMNPNGAPVFWL